MDRTFTPRSGVFLGLFLVFISFLLTTYSSLSYGAAGEGSVLSIMMTGQVFSGTSNGQFKNLGGIGADASGHIYVVDLTDGKIEKLDGNGTLVTLWGSLGAGQGQMNNTHSIAVYPCSNNLYIADTDNNRIQMFDNKGKFLRDWGSRGAGSNQFNLPQGIALD